MSNYTPPTINHLALGELSRRKLHMVSMLPSDTLRRAVLIHNIVRSTASLPPSPTTTTTIFDPQSESQSESAYDYYPHSPAHVSEEDHAVQAEMTLREAAATADAGSDNDMFVFPTPMTSSAQEQVWLDSLLDDLDDDPVHVSVVEAEDHDGSEGEVEDAYPLFATGATPCTSAPPPSLPPVSPSLTIPYRHQQAAYSEPAEPPRSPPELDAHSFSDDDDDEDYMDDDDEAVTPSSSTELGSSDSYFFGSLPFHCHFQPIN